MAARTVAPFQYAGGKHRIAPLVWQALSADIPRFIEPFAGSLGVLLARPGEHDGGGEVINDADGFIVNVWRAIRHAPDEVAWWLTGPASTADLNARHRWVHSEGVERVRAVFTDPEHYDAKTAAWYVYGLNVAPHPRAWTNVGADSASNCRANVKLIGHLANWRQPLDAYLARIADRINRAIILADDWATCVTPAMLRMSPSREPVLRTGVFLDPPYDGSRRRENLYGTDSPSVAADVLAWCLANGDRPKLRIVLAGYDGEHNELEDHGWRVASWSSAGGGASRYLERLWFSPHCLEAGDDGDGRLEGVT